MTTRSAVEGRVQPVRWGFVGTGKIATWMAGVVETTPAATLVAVTSRRMVAARSFAARHRADKAFDSWGDMLAWDNVDAVYVATPTSLKEEICSAAANAGKHVLSEKPFASLASLQRVAAACLDSGVAFMDATHFVHHPRFAAIQARHAETTGQPQSLDSRFLVSLTDREDIRYDPGLEPLGALGDLGWYNMRATVEYLAPNARLRSVEARLQRDAETGAVVAAEGSIGFDDQSVSSWRCSFTALSTDIGLELRGPRGAIRMDNFVGEERDGSASYRYVADGDEAGGEVTVCVESRRSSPALMFGEFAEVARDSSQRERWILASERTQMLLDAVSTAVEGVRQ